MPLNYSIVAAMARAMREKGMAAGVDVKGARFAPLKPATIRAKKRKGYAQPSTPLSAKLVLRRPTISSDKQGGYVHVPKSRAAISEYHDKGLGHNPVRHHWGMYSGVETRVRRYFEEFERQLLAKHFGGA